MFSISLLLLLKAAFWSLRLGGIGKSSFPRALKPEEEEKLVERLSQGDRYARDKLIEHNLRLVAHVCKKYYSRYDQEDLISMGTIGLIKGIDSFRPDMNTKLSTYVARCIDNEVLMQFRKDHSGYHEFSLNGFIEVGDEESNLTLLDTIASNNNIIEDLERQEDSGRLKELVRSILTPRETQVMVARFGLDGNPPETQSGIGKRLNISRSYVSRIEKRAIEKLRREFIDMPEGHGKSKRK
ncbi:MAG: sigma-70 family RNA polymerase sigma factor [Oscillospiraceae bacterium]|jgi:RNA polymerase sporulation-specific sigma factor|nr:sigma-70 family RNA polymerase sigma factor [Oscillospiraceae bacterium]